MSQKDERGPIHWDIQKGNNTVQGIALAVFQGAIYGTDCLDLNKMDLIWVFPSSITEGWVLAKKDQDDDAKIGWIPENYCKSEDWVPGMGPGMASKELETKGNPVQQHETSRARTCGSASCMTWPPVCDVNEFEVWVDGSGGKRTWGVGMADVREEKEFIYGGYEKYLGALRTGKEDGNMAEVLGLYIGLSYARAEAQTTTGGGIIVCDKTSLLVNIMQNTVTDPVTAVGLNLVRHAMIKTLETHTYVRFVHKRFYGYGDKWTPDALAKQGKKEAKIHDHRISLPDPLRTGAIRFVAPRWKNRSLLLSVTILRAD